MQVDLTGKGSKLDKNLIFIKVSLECLFFSHGLFLFCLWQPVLHFRCLAALAQPTCLCCCVCSTKATVQLTSCAILSTVPLTYSFPFPPVGYRVQKEVGFSGYQA